MARPVHRGPSSRPNALYFLPARSNSHVHAVFPSDSPYRLTPRTRWCSPTFPGHTVFSMTLLLVAVGADSGGGGGGGGGSGLW